MIFDLHPWKYRVRVCPGPIEHDGERVLATVHGRDILLSGELKPTERLEALIDQLRHLRERYHGELTAEHLPSFVADVMAQLLRQGGHATLLRLGPDGLVDAGAAVGLAAEPTGCECAKCGTKYTPHQIRTEAAEFDHGAGRLTVRRAVDCDFCGHVQSWTEGATASGAPDGRVMAGPFFSKPQHVTTSFE